MRIKRTVTGLLFLFLLSPCIARAQDFKAWELKTAQFKQWLDARRGDAYKFWTRLDGSRRPHKLYVAEGFNKAELKDQEQFVEVFSHYLAGHPDKFMLIDLYDAGTGAAIGEFGWGGFKLFVSAPSQPSPDKTTTTSDSADGALANSKSSVEH